MFAGSLIDFIAPNFIGQIIDQFKAYNFDGDKGVHHLVKVWILWTVFSSVCAFIREVIFGVTS